MVQDGFTLACGLRIFKMKWNAVDSTEKVPTLHSKGLRCSNLDALGMHWGSLGYIWGINQHPHGPLRTLYTPCCFAVWRAAMGRQLGGWRRGFCFLEAESDVWQWQGCWQFLNHQTSASIVCFCLTCKYCMFLPVRATAAAADTRPN